MYQAFQAVKVNKPGDDFHGQVGNVRILPNGSDPAYYVKLDTDASGALRQYAADELAGL